LYTLLIGLSVALAFNRVASHDAIPNSTDWAECLRLVAFLATLFPFALGAIRYLDVAYITGEEQAKQTGIWMDGALLLIEAVLLTTAASLINDHNQFWICYGILLVLDLTWVGTTGLHKEKPQVLSPTIKLWGSINLVFFMIMMLVAFSRYWDTPFQHYIISAIAVVRSLVDVMLTKNVYFPASSPINEN